MFEATQHFFDRVAERGLASADITEAYKYGKRFNPAIASFHIITPEYYCRGPYRNEENIPDDPVKKKHGYKSRARNHKRQQFRITQGIFQVEEHVILMAFEKGITAFTAYPAPLENNFFTGRTCL